MQAVETEMSRMEAVKPEGMAVCTAAEVEVPLAVSTAMEVDEVAAVCTAVRTAVAEAEADEVVVEVEPEPYKAEVDLADYTGNAVADPAVANPDVADPDVVDPTRDYKSKVLRRRVADVK